jgi:hypothetical protein
LRQRKLHVALMRFHLNELEVVKNEAGRTNIVTLLNRVEERLPATGGLNRMLGDFQFTGIDVLNLTLGKAKYVDLQNPRNNREIDLNFQNQIFKNVKSTADVYGILFMIWLRSGGNLFAVPKATP